MAWAFGKLCSWPTHMSDDGLCLTGKKNITKAQSCIYEHTTMVRTVWESVRTHKLPAARVYSRHYRGSLGESLTSTNVTNTVFNNQDGMLEAQCI